MDAGFAHAAALVVTVLTALALFEERRRARVDTPRTERGAPTRTMYAARFRVDARERATATPPECAAEE